MDSVIKIKNYESVACDLRKLSKQNLEEARSTIGIENAVVSYNVGTAVVTYDTDIISLKDIAAIIRKSDYHVVAGGQRQTTSNSSHLVGIILVIVHKMHMR
jgi:copper chaperone CopZ